MLVTFEADLTENQSDWLSVLTIKDMIKIMIDLINDVLSTVGKPECITKVGLSYTYCNSLHMDQ
jgi:hypothetical protein